MAETPGTKMAPEFELFYASSMPVLLTKPTPDPSYNNKPTVRVEPGLIRLGSPPYRLTEVVWLNQTGGDVRFTFDAAGSARFFDLTSHGPQPFLVHDGKPLTLPISTTPPQNSIFSYRVDCDVTPQIPAQGNSPPQVSCP